MIKKAEALEFRELPLFCDQENDCELQNSRDVQLNF